MTQTKVSRIQRWRTGSRLLLVALIALHMLAWGAGLRVVGSIASEAFFDGLARGVLNAGFVFWTLVFAATLVFGRAFCGWFCWFGGYLDLIEWSVGKFKIKIPRRAPLYLGLLAFVNMGLKIYKSTVVYWLQGFPTAVTFDLADFALWQGQVTGISIMVVLVIFGPALLYVFGERAWCRYLCPIAPLLKILDKAALGRIRLVSADCTGCGACARACPMEVDVPGQLVAYGEVRDWNCIRCFKCRDACPKQALNFTWKRALVKLSDKATANAARLSAQRRQRSLFDVIIIAVWLTLTLVMAFASTSQAAPQALRAMMTAGLLIIVYSVVWLGRAAWQAHSRDEAGSL